MKNYLTSLVIMEMQIKNTMKYYTSTSMAKIKKTDSTKFWQGFGTIRTLIYCLYDCKSVQPIWQKVWHFLVKLNITPIL